MSTFDMNNATDVAHSQEDDEYMEFKLFMSRREYKMIRKRPVYMGKVRWNDRMRIKTMVNGELRITRPRYHSDQYMREKEKPLS